MRRRLALVVAAGATVISACSGGGSKGAAPTTTTPAEKAAATKSADLRDFCGRMSALTSSIGQVGIVTQLSQVKEGLSLVSQQIDNAVLAGVPAGSNLFPAVLALDNDMKAVNAWIQTKATQDDLDHNRQPSDVHTRFTDLGFQLRSIQTWTGTNCKAFTGGDGG